MLTFSVFGYQSEKNTNSELPFNHAFKAIDDYCRSCCLELNVLKSNYTVLTTVRYRSNYEKLYGDDLYLNNLKIP